MKPSLRETQIVRLAIVRPITMLMALLSVLVLGAVAVMHIPLEMVPRGIQAPFMSVSVPLTDATARDVEDKITIPLEQAVSTIPQIERVLSTSSRNQARVNLQFENTANMDRAYLDLRDRINRVRPDLPDEVQTIQIQKHSADGLPVGVYGVTWPEHHSNPQELITRKVIQKIERIDGVGMVRAMGNEDREIRIEIDRKRAEAANLNIFQLAQQLAQSHFTLSSGMVVEGEEKYLVRSLAEYKTPEQLGAVVVGPNDVRLSDVADIVYEYPEGESFHRYNGKDVMALFVLKESEANTAEVCAKIEELLQELSVDPSFAGFGTETFFSQADAIHSSLQQVMESGLTGGILAVVVLLFFLRRVRLTLIIALSIPLSMFMSLPVMYFSGQSINLLSLLGLMICVGLVVDNSVVVAENIARYRIAGMGHLASALHGASEVALPIALATATTMVVFLPAALLSSGMTRAFMVQMVTPICVSLLASLFVALVLIPMTSSYLLNNSTPSTEYRRTWFSFFLNIDRLWKTKVGRAYDATFGRIRNAYVRLLRKCLDRRFDVFMIGLLALMSLSVPMNPESGVKSVIDNGEGGRQVRVHYVIPSHVRLEEIDRFFRKLDTWFEPWRKKGVAGHYMEVREGFSSISIFFEPPKSSDQKPKEIGKEIFNEMPCPAGWKKESEFGSSDGAEPNTFRVFVYGDSHDVVNELKEDLQKRLLQVDGVISLSSSGRDSSKRNELAISVDPVMSKRLGVDPAVIGNTIGYAVRGSRLPRIHGENDEIDVWIRYKKSDREQMRDIERFRVPTRTGDSVALGSLTSNTVREGESVLVRNNKQVAGVVELEIEDEDAMATMNRIRAAIQEIQVPEGAYFDSREKQRELDGQNRDMMMGLMLGFVFIFLLMGFLFESFILPLSVVPAIPLSFVGVWWSLYLTGSDLDAIAGIGLFLLIGVVVNNAIVLIDFVNHSRQKGLERIDAIIEAGAQRFRPIMMTTLTTVGGMLPLALSKAPEEGIAYTSFGRVLVGGLTSSTILTLVVVPVTYVILDDVRTSVLVWLANKNRRLSRG